MPQRGTTGHRRLCLQTDTVLGWRKFFLESLVDDFSRKSRTLWSITVWTIFVNDSSCDSHHGESMFLSQYVLQCVYWWLIIWLLFLCSSHLPFWHTWYKQKEVSVRQNYLYYICQQVSNDFSETRLFSEECYQFRLVENDNENFTARGPQVTIIHMS